MFAMTHGINIKIVMDLLRNSQEVLGTENHKISKANQYWLKSFFLIMRQNSQQKTRDTKRVTKETMVAKRHLVAICPYQEIS